VCDGRVVAVQALVTEPAEPETKGELLVGIGRETQARPEHLGELLPPCSGLEAPGELVQGKGVVWNGATRREQRRQGLLRKAVLLAYSRETMVCGSSECPFGLGLRSQCGPELFGVSLSLGGRCDGRGQERVAAALRERLAKELRRLLRRVQPVLGESRRGGQVEGPELRVRDGLGELQPHVSKGARVPAGLERRLELLQHGNVPGGLILAGAQKPQGLVRFAEAILEDDGPFVHQRHPRLRTVHGAGFGLEELGHHLPVSHLAEEPPRRAEVGRVARVRPVRILVANGRVAGRLERSLPEAPHFVVEASGIGVCAEGFRLALEEKEELASGS
jgi:hypothetical protein